MPSTRPTVDPVLDILEEMGYDFDELEGDGYKRSIKEAIIKLTNKDPKDSRIGTLIEELKKVKKSRKTEVKEKKTTIKASKFLPGRGKFSADNIKSNNEAEMGQDGGKKDKIIAFLNGDVKDNLDDVRDDLKQIEGLISDQNKSADEQYEEMRQGILAGKKKKREEDLEKKDKKPGDNKMLDMIAKPAGSFFDKIIRFITFTFLGSVVNRLISILNDPAQLLDPIKKFFNAIIGMVNVVMKGLWDITGAPINFIIGGINDGVKFIIDGINSVSSKLNLPEIPSLEIPLVPGPPEIPEIPLSKTAQEQNEEAVVGMAGGGLVPGYNEGGKVQTLSEKLGHTRGVITDPEEIKKEKEYMLKFVNEEREFQGLPPLKEITLAPGVEMTKMLGPGPRTKEESTTDIDFGTMTRSTATSKWVEGKGTKLSGEVGGLTEADREKFIAENPIVRQLANVKDQVELDKLGSSIGAKAKMSGGGIVPGPYPTTNLLGMGHNVIDTAPNNIMGYNKGGKVPGSGSGDTVPAMLTPGEFVMSKGAVDKIGVDNLMAMNKDGGGTNVPKMMKFAGGGSVPDIGTPNKKGGPVIIMGGGGGSQAPNIQAPSQSPEGVPKFSSTDPNNMNKVVIKSLYNMVG